MIIKLREAAQSYDKIIKVIKNGGIIAIPTDTVYGFAVDGKNPQAVDRLIRLKKRDDRPFTFFIAQDRIKNYAVITKPRIIESFIPGPLTVILKKRQNVSLPLIEEKLGIRIPETDFVINLLERFDSVLAVTSANISGEPPIISPYEIVERFPEIEVVVDAGMLNTQVSTVLDLTTTPPTLKRKGAVSLLELERVYGRPVLMDKGLRFNVLFVCTGNTCRSPMASGILKTLIEPQYCEVDSAGTSAVSGLPPARFAMDVVKEYGGSIEEHRTKYLTYELIARADLILVMEMKHYDAVLELSSKARTKTFLLREYKRGTGKKEVPDPVGRDRSAYEEVARIMLPILKRVAQDIERHF
ncbi:threonylcarbamoyl-AMP synthase [candidate division WOR-3 bacterium 4484_100]|uniref:L-threonylcarbamoyladenylate synthase n=1 Tax=candidate division WOR-3 bacterium 4484_100 TaxID=1936077 RepID=A0A1V4QFU7_UNCW3|nr:MAG: threonylcarbamoyl-AMP synthase [candidate division WOR-3 bacterium 4484_100]